MVEITPRAFCDGLGGDDFRVDFPVAIVVTHQPGYRADCCRRFSLRKCLSVWPEPVFLDMDFGLSIHTLVPVTLYYGKLNRK